MFHQVSRSHVVDLKQLPRGDKALLIGASVRSRINQPEAITSRRRSLSKARPGSGLPYDCIALFSDAVDLRKLLET